MSLLELKRGNWLLPINKQEDDLFICASSFEDRSRRAAELLSPQYRTKQALVVFYRDTLNHEKGKKNLECIDRCLKKHASKIDGIICDFRNTYSLISELERKENEGKLILQSKFITIDITCFTKLHLLLLLRYLSWKTKAVFRFVYTEPLTYSTMAGENLSYGFLELVTVKYKISQTYENKKGSCYIFFIGHEFARTYKAFELLEPERYWIIKGTPGYSLQLELFSQRENEFLIRKAERLKTLKSASTKDPFDVMNCLREISQEEKEKENLVFIPCGTKLQTLGIFMFSQITHGFNLIVSYPMPLRYEEKTYSRGFGKTRIIFWSNIVEEEEGHNLGLYSQIITRKELYE